ncbi:hypothetical protein LDDCCGHA_2597 [Methylobacterium oxalidis]|nr:hypothetical protein LDDCCGHA_2597 [Methylobacterium oxalidis]
MTGNGQVAMGCGDAGGERNGRRPMRAAAGLAVAAALAATLALPGAGPASAQGEGEGAKGSPIKLQLNRLEPAGDACRTYVLVDNSRGGALKSLKVDLFAFDTEGVAQKRVAVELGPLAEKKTSVKIFDFAGIACPKIGRVLLNDVLSCEGGEASREGCLERTETESKASVPFDR